MPDAAGNFKGIALPDIPWHKTSPDECSFDQCPYEGEGCKEGCRYPKDNGSTPTTDLSTEPLGRV